MKSEALEARLAALTIALRVFFQDLQPIADVVGMTDGGDNAKGGTDKRRRHFGHQFLAGIICRAEFGGEVTIKPASCDPSNGPIHGKPCGNS